ncbi:MAG: hypothetical protein ACP6IP_09910 [Candidatus Njordarchaeia archaeon]
MDSIKIVQERLSSLIKIALLPAPTELGRFTVRILEAMLPKYKDELGLDFDYMRIHTGAQPRDSGDIELYKDKNLVKRISVKTAVSGKISTALYKLWKDIVDGMDGIIIVFCFAKKGEGEEKAKMLLIYIPHETIKYKKEEVLDEIEAKINERRIREGYVLLQPFAVNEALMFETVYKTTKLEEEMAKTREKTEEIYEEARKASEKAEKAYEEAKEIRKELGDVKREISELVDSIKKMLGKRED